MKKTLILLTSLFLIFGCGEEKATVENEKSVIVDISKYNEQELYEYIIYLEDNLLDTANNSLVPNKGNSIKLLESSNNFAERFPTNKERINVLYKGVRASRGLSKFHEALRILDKIIREYPNNELMVELLFEKAFINDENLNNKEEAKRIYTQISEKYPTHLFGEQSKARLVTIDMTEDEFTNWLMEQNAE